MNISPSLLGHLAAAAVCALFSGCGRDPAPPETYEVLMNVYNLGEKAGFGLGGDSHRFCDVGWANSEKMFRWTIAQRALLHVRVQPTNGPIRLIMKLGANTHPPELPFQPVDVLVNATKVEHWEVAAGPKNYPAVIPASIVAAGGLLRIELQIPRATPPVAQDGGSRERRQLGVKCFEMQMVRYHEQSASQ